MEALEAAREATATYGIASIEAQLAWETVEEKIKAEQAEQTFCDMYPWDLECRIYDC